MTIPGILGGSLAQVRCCPHLVPGNLLEAWRCGAPSSPWVGPPEPSGWVCCGSSPFSILILSCSLLPPMELLSAVLWGLARVIHSPVGVVPATCRNRWSEHFISFPGLRMLNLERSTDLRPCNVLAEPSTRPADSGLETLIPAWVPLSSSPRHSPRTQRSVTPQHHCAIRPSRIKLNISPLSTRSTGLGLPSPPRLLESSSPAPLFLIPNKPGRTSLQNTARWQTHQFSRWGGGVPLCAEAGDPVLFLKPLS